MNILKELDTYIKEFNQLNNVEFYIDTIRVKFNKTHIKNKLDSLGDWKRLSKNSNILKKLKKKENNKQITTVYRLNNYNIYYYNLQDKPKYRKAILIIFSLKQYEQDMSIKTISKKMIDKVLSIVVNSAVSQKDKINIDICLDMFNKPIIENLNNYYSLKQYIAPNGKPTDTFYINKPNMLLVDRVVIYNKQYKNKLQSEMYRLEATIPVYNLHCLYLPLDDILKELISPIIATHID